MRSVQQAKDESQGLPLWGPEAPQFRKEEGSMPMGGVLWEMQLGRALFEKRPRTPILSKKLSHHVFYGNRRKRGV